LTLFASAVGGHNDLLMIVDEIQTGLGRTGSMYASDFEGITPDIMTIAIDPTNPATLYAGTSHGVVKSTNSGGSWAKVYGASGYWPRIRAIAIDPANPRTVYAGGDDGVVKTIDGGGTWTRFTEGMDCINLASIAIDQNNPSTIFIGSF